MIDFDGDGHLGWLSEDGELPTDTRPEAQSSAEIAGSEAREVSVGSLLRRETSLGHET